MVSSKGSVLRVDAFVTHRRFCFDLPHTKEKLSINGAEIETFFEQTINNCIKFIRGIILRVKRDLISLCTHIWLTEITAGNFWKSLL